MKLIWLILTFKNKSGKTLLHYCAINGLVYSIEKLLKRAEESDEKIQKMQKRN